MANAGTFVVNALSAYSGGTETMDNVYLDTITAERPKEEPKPERTGEEIKTYMMERINSLGA